MPERSPATPRDDPPGSDNAYMFPNEDGVPSWSGMFPRATAKGPAVKGTKKTQPRTLTATGVASGLPLGIGLLAGAVVMGLVLRRPRRRRATLTKGGA